MKNGWIKSYRKILEHELLANDNNAFIVFMKLLHHVDKQTGSVTTGRFKMSELTNLNPNTVYATLKRLEKAKMITQKPNNRFTTIHICNWKRYQGNDNTVLQQPDNNQITLNKNKEVRINDTNVSFGKPEINEMFNYWNELVGSAIQTNVKANRNACNNLLKKHGERNLKRLVQGVAIAQSDRYAPRIANFVQLQAKLDDLILWGKKQTNKIGVV